MDCFEGIDAVHGRLKDRCNESLLSFKFSSSLFYSLLQHGFTFLKFSPCNYLLCNISCHSNNACDGTITFPERFIYKINIHYIRKPFPGYSNWLCLASVSLTRCVNMGKYLFQPLPC